MRHHGLTRRLRRAWTRLARLNAWDPTDVPGLDPDPWQPGKQPPCEMDAQPEILGPQDQVLGEYLAEWQDMPCGHHDHGRVCVAGVRHIAHRMPHVYVPERQP